MSDLDISGRDAVEVYPCGTPVRLCGEIDGTICGVSIRNDVVVSYQVVWWDGRNRHEEWVWADEVTAADDAPKRSVGFLR